MMDIALIKDGPDGVDVDCYFAGTFIGCARLLLDGDPIVVDCSPLLKEHIAEDADRLAYLVDRVQVMRAE